MGRLAGKAMGAAGGASRQSYGSAVVPPTPSFAKVKRSSAIVSLAADVQRIVKLAFDNLALNATLGGMAVPAAVGGAIGGVYGLGRSKGKSLGRRAANITQSTLNGAGGGVGALAGALTGGLAGGALSGGNGTASLLSMLAGAGLGGYGGNRLVNLATEPLMGDEQKEAAVSASGEGNMPVIDAGPVVYGRDVDLTPWHRTTRIDSITPPNGRSDFLFSKEAAGFGSQMARRVGKHLGQAKLTGPYTTPPGSGWAQRLGDAVNTDPDGLIMSPAASRALGYGMAGAPVGAGVLGAMSRFFGGSKPAAPPVVKKSGVLGTALKNLAGPVAGGAAGAGADYAANGSVSPGSVVMGAGLGAMAKPVFKAIKGNPADFLSGGDVANLAGGATAVAGGGAAELGGLGWPKGAPPTGAGHYSSPAAAPKPAAPTLPPRSQSGMSPAESLRIARSAGIKIPGQGDPRQVINPNAAIDQPAPQGHFEQYWPYYAAAGIGLPAAYMLYKKTLGAEEEEKQSSVKTAGIGAMAGKALKPLWNGIKHPATREVGLDTLGFGAGYTGSALTRTAGSDAPIMDRITDPKNFWHNTFGGIGGMALTSPTLNRMSWSNAQTKIKDTFGPGYVPSVTETIPQFALKEFPKAFGYKALVAGVPDMVGGIGGLFGAAKDVKTITGNTAEASGSYKDLAAAAGKELSQASKNTNAATQSFNTAAKSVPALTTKLDEVLDTMANSPLSQLSSNLDSTLTAGKNFLKDHGAKLGIGLGVGIPAIYLLGKYLQGSGSKPVEKKKSPIGAGGGGGTGAVNNTRLKAPRVTLKKPGDYNIRYQDDDVPDEYPAMKAARVALQKTLGR